MSKQKDSTSDRSKTNFDAAESAKLLDEQQEKQRNDRLVDEAGEETFPASDPPSYNPGTATPKHSRDNRS